MVVALTMLVAGGRGPVFLSISFLPMEKMSHEPGKGGAKKRAEFHHFASNGGVFRCGIFCSV